MECALSEACSAIGLVLSCIAYSESECMEPFSNFFAFSEHSKGDVYEASNRHHQAV